MIQTEPETPRREEMRLTDVCRDHDSSLLKHTFVHIPGIGLRTERNLWEQGIRTWDDVDPAFGDDRNAVARQLRRYIPQSQQAVARHDISFFDRLSRLGEAWRLFPDFSHDCVYVDIETTGLSPVFDSVTMVGVFDGSEYRLFVQGLNLDELPKVLESYSVIVTFNGGSFDLRFLRSAFPDLRLPPIHIDLRWLTRKLGQRGGLKEVESAFGLVRPQRTAALTGRDAPVLWSRYRRGDAAALDLLIEYNTQDVVNLKVIMEQCYARLAERTADFLSIRPAAKKQARRLPRASNVEVSLGSEQLTTSSVLSDLQTRAAARGHGVKVVGIDLSGSERKASGWAFLDGESVTTRRVFSDDELIERTVASRPALVSIDSPLSLPGGVTSTDQRRKAGLPIYRACELALKRMGISVFWCLLPSMEQLTLRGMRLTKMLRSRGLEVIESYPGAAQDLLGIPRKGTSLEELRWGLRRLGVEGQFMSTKVSHDEVDAITSAIVGVYYLAGEHIALGNSAEDYLIVPRPPWMDYARLAGILSASGLEPVSPASPAEATERKPSRNKRGDRRGPRRATKRVRCK